MSASDTGPALANEAMITSVSTVLARVLLRDVHEISADTRLFEDLGLDSTGTLELVIELENELGIELEVDFLDQEHFASVRSLADTLSAQADR
ncbi:acyl carrier protein [Streptomyces sp. NPDC056452]|uniref:acyl carrier protein n=1 Tax=Streptomyces sp. NPDC056452 TaxID=3345821 RepID=UPI0036AD6CB7